MLQVCPDTEVKVYDLNGPVDVPWESYEAAKEALDAHEFSRSGRFDWKMDQWDWDERMGWGLWERSSHLYFRVCFHA